MQIPADFAGTRPGHAEIPPKKVSPHCTSRLSPRLPFSMEICSFFPREQTLPSAGSGWSCPAALQPPGTNPSPGSVS